jgi:hypothetical protein
VSFPAKVIAISSLGLLTIIFLLIAMFPGLIMRPPLWIEYQGHSAILHFETLGEYPSDVRRIVIADQRSLHPILDLEEDGTFQIRNFKVSTGANSALQVRAEHGAYRVVKPQPSDEFTLSPDVNYNITIWGKSGLPARRVLRF